MGVIITIGQLKEHLTEGLLNEGRIDDVVNKYLGNPLPTQSGRMIDPPGFEMLEKIKHALKHENNYKISRGSMHDAFRVLDAQRFSKVPLSWYRSMDPDDPRNLHVRTAKAFMYLSGLIHADPAPTRSSNKYLDWMANQVLVRFEPIDEVIETVKEFESDKSIQPRDIWQFKTLGELRGAIEATSELKLKNLKVTTDQYDRVYEDDEVVIIRPKTALASQKYGAGTRWCISATKSKNWFETYRSTGGEHFFLIKRNPQGDEWDKVSMTYTDYAAAIDKEHLYSMFEKFNVRHRAQVKYYEPLRFFDALDNMHSFNSASRYIPKLHEYVAMINGFIQTFNRSSDMELRLNAPMFQSTIWYTFIVEGVPIDMGELHDILFSSMIDSDFSAFVKEYIDKKYDEIDDDAHEREFIPDFKHAASLFAKQHGYKLRIYESNQ